MLSMIAAKSINGVIGAKGTLPWHFSEDFKWFKKTTMGSTLIVGRKTFESMGVLPGRDCIVISSKKLKHDKVAKNLEEAINMADPNKPIFLAGGTRVFEEGLNRVDSIYLTIVHQEFEGDTYFPAIPWKNYSITYSTVIEQKGVCLRFIKAERLK